MSKLVTLEQAKKLKELGFDSDRFGFCFDIVDNRAEVDANSKNKGEYKVFYIHEALEWFREEKGIVAEIKVSKYTKPLEYMFRIYEYCADLRSYESHSHKLGFSTHPLAESALLDEIIKYLEK